MNSLDCAELRYAPTIKRDKRVRPVRYRYTAGHSLSGSKKESNRELSFVDRMAFLVLRAYTRRLRYVAPCR